MGFPTATIVNTLLSHAKKCGRFSSVSARELITAPPSGVAVSIYFARMVPTLSGLASTSTIAVFTVELSMVLPQFPADGVEVDLLNAHDVLCAAYSGDFDLGVEGASIDLLGDRIPMESVAGYKTIGKQLLRVISITVPVSVNDVWSQVR
jgi:hypothetical protein